MDIQKQKLNLSFNYLVILAVLIALGVAGRLLPHPPNFTPMAAIALFAGFIFLKRYMAVIAVVVTMLLTDYFALAIFLQSGLHLNQCGWFILLYCFRLFLKTIYRKS